MTVQWMFVTITIIVCATVIVVEYIENKFNQKG
ncbi:hypothetical protein LCGC14_0684440 [marine sediment metagenome]|uniref:Uncharacterized protein n=1 Tax=marine sediment metagenome TaxID=412755 RepID=A0A0F9T8L1_9ZZZZ